MRRSCCRTRKSDPERKSSILALPTGTVLHRQKKVCGSKDWKEEDLLQDRFSDPERKTSSLAVPEHVRPAMVQVNSFPSPWSIQ